MIPFVHVIPFILLNITPFFQKIQVQEQNLFIFFVKIRHHALDFAVGIPFFDIVPAVIFMFTLRQTDLHFDKSSFEIE